MSERIKSIIESSARDYNFEFFCDAIEDFHGLRNITTTEDFNIANDAIDAIDRLFKDLDGDL